MDRVDNMICEIRKEYIAKGLGGIKGLGALFRRFDSDYSKCLTKREFAIGMQKYGIKMDTPDLNEVFDRIDKDGSGSIDFKEFLKVLCGPIPQCRLKVITDVFRTLDTVQDGKLKVEDSRGKYQHLAMNHHKFLSGQWTVDDVLQKFLDNFDSKDGPDGTVTLEEFIEYYVAVSSTIDDDAYFDMMMRQSWGISSNNKI